MQGAYWKVMMNRPSRTRVRENLAVNWLAKIIEANKTQNFSTLDVDWENIKKTLEDLKLSGTPRENYLLTVIILSLDEYCRMRGKNKEYIQMLQIAQEFAGKFLLEKEDEYFDLFEYVDFSPQVNTSEYTTEDVRALYENNVGKVYLLAGQIRQAEELFRKALKRVQQTGYQYYQAMILINLGVVHKHKSEYAQAIKYYDQAQKVAESIHNNDLIGAALGNAGEAYRKMGEFQTAIEYFNKALDVNSKDLIGRGIRLGNLGSAHAQLGQYSQAKKYYFEALNIAVRIHDKEGEANRKANLGRVEFQLGQKQEGINLIKEGLALKKDLNDVRGMAEDYFWIGTIEIEQGTTQEGMVSLENSRKLYQQLGDNESMKVIYEFLHLQLINLLTKFLNLERTIALSPLDMLAQKEYAETVMSIAALLDKTIDTQSDLNEFISWLGNHAEQMLLELRTGRRSGFQFNLSDWVWACCMATGIGLASFQFLDMYGIFILALGIGVAQWSIFRHLNVGFGWAVMTFLGIILGVVPFNLIEPTTPFVTGAIFGTTCGFVQWLIIRGKFRLSAIWIFANLVGFAVGFYAFIESLPFWNAQLARLGFENRMLANGLGGIFLGLFLGLFTGLAFIIINKTQVTRSMANIAST